MKKVLFLIPILLLVGCNNTQNEIVTEKSDLRGTFVNNEVIDAKYKKQIQDGNNLYATLYPLSIFLNDDQGIAYRIDQRLKLNSDYTYNYEYSIVLGSAESWGNLQVSKIYVNIFGVFQYKKYDNENSFSVRLSNPTSGKEEFYGCHIWNLSSYKDNEIHPEADYVLDFDTLSQLGNYQFDKYVQNRTVIVRKAVEENQDNTVEDNIFFSDILDDLGHFNTY